MLIATSRIYHEHCGTPMKSLEWFNFIVVIVAQSHITAHVRSYVHTCSHIAIAISVKFYA